MADVISDVLNQSLWEAKNSSYAKQAAYRLEALRFFGATMEVDERYDIGDTYTTKLISRDNNMADSVKAGSRNYKQGLPDSVESFTQAYDRLGKYLSWTENDELKLQEALNRLRGDPIGNYNAFLEGVTEKSPRRLIEAFYRAVDAEIWFGKANKDLISQKFDNNIEPTLTNIPSLMTANPANKVTTNGVGTHPKIERVAANNVFTAANAKIAANQIKDINLEMITKCGFGVNRVILPADVAQDVDQSATTLELKTLTELLKPVMPDVEVIASETLLRYGIKDAIVFHYSTNYYDNVCSCRLSQFALKEKFDIDTWEIHGYGVCGGLEVKIPDGIKIITGIKS